MTTNLSERWVVTTESPVSAELPPAKDFSINSTLYRAWYGIFGKIKTGHVGFWRRHLGISLRLLRMHFTHSGIGSAH